MYRECDSVVSSQTTPALVVWRIKTEYSGFTTFFADNISKK